MVRKRINKLSGIGTGRSRPVKINSSGTVWPGFHFILKLCTSGSGDQAGAMLDSAPHFDFLGRGRRVNSIPADVKPKPMRTESGKKESPDIKAVVVANVTVRSEPLITRF